MKPLGALCEKRHGHRYLLQTTELHYKLHLTPLTPLPASTTATAVLSRHRMRRTDRGSRRRIPPCAATLPAASPSDSATCLLGVCVCCRRPELRVLVGQTLGQSLTTPLRERAARTMTAPHLGRVKNAHGNHTLLCTIAMVQQTGRASCETRHIHLWSLCQCQHRNAVSSGGVFSANSPAAAFRNPRCVLQWSEKFHVQKFRL